MRRLQHLPKFIVAICLLASLAACSEDDGMGPESTAGVSEASIVRDGLELKISASKASFPEDVSIVLTFRVENVSTQALRYEFTSTNQHDFAVEEDGRQAWRWTAGRAFGRTITSLKLQPGESKAWSEIWDQRDNSGELVGPGVYMVSGVLPVSGGRLVSEFLEITIEE